MLASKKWQVILISSVVLVLGAAGALLAQTATINGAGATFPYPLYAQWAYRYEKTTGVKINYQAIGSGGGIAQIKAGTVDFGGSDAPMKKDELDQAGLVQFPMVMGGVVPVINLPGVKAGSVGLTPALLADIFLGKITKWNDPAIAAVNTAVKLPAKDITVVHRADGSGTTWIFTNYLDKVSPEWHAKVGCDKAVSWPIGVGGKGNEGVAAYVQKINGAVGYVEFAYALQNKMTYLQLQNKAGKFVPPTIESFQAAASNADWSNAPGFYMVLTDQPGEGTWPITGATFILLRKAQGDGAKAKTLLSFFDWCYHHGGETARSLQYVPMPDAVIARVQAEWGKAIQAGGQSLWP
jgi:phosphate transport system substrate-binding protein